MKKSIGAKSLAYPTPVWLVGTYDMFGNANAMTAAWGGICCSDPPCIAVSLRKATYSYANIMEKEAFTISIPTEDYVKETDYFGIASGKDVNKFEKMGLTPVKSDLVYAPYVEEFPIVLECKLIQSFELGLHTQFIGEIVDIKADESILDEKNNPEIKKIRPIIYSPERSYYGLGEFLGKAFSIGMEGVEK
ncbi:flavin reductase family protein [Methanolobus bombayensis]|uniref:flavin reductase family protein n=1 Tax=Methanolobus bombayensis TaxID=38023 RepID=UPI001AE4E65C|nr:flavin reductase family protein [Methanolobus bombayensis]MBP1909340.1 flavin reductase (DIM6/NTAB) family NADH-FMN oxidoreductase RutF [Methanolobus bombayensis]